MDVGTSVETYTSPEDCVRDHPWGIQFEPDAVWEDGSPVVQPESNSTAGLENEPSGATRMIQVDGAEFGAQMEALLRHIRKLRVDGFDV
jgi:hypothetical protein